MGSYCKQYPLHSGTSNVFFRSSPCFSSIPDAKTYLFFRFVCKFTYLHFTEEASKFWKIFFSQSPSGSLRSRAVLSPRPASSDLL